MTVIKQAVTIATQSPKRVIQVTLGKRLLTPLEKTIFHTIDSIMLWTFSPSVFLICAARCTISRHKQLFREIVQAKGAIQILWPRGLHSLRHWIAVSTDRPTHKEVASIALSWCWWLLFTQACCDLLKLVLCLGSLKWNPSQPSRKNPARWKTTE